MIPDDFDDGELKGTGFTVHVPEDGREVRSLDHELDADGMVFHCRVAGVSFHADALRQRCFDPGSPVRITPEPTNTHDPNALKVTDPKGRHHVGYVPAELAEIITADRQEARPIDGFVTMVFSKGGERFGLRVVGALGAPLSLVRAN